jgi:cbb3-type cytochrome oxidase subunit 3
MLETILALVVITIVFAIIIVAAFERKARRAISQKEVAN